MTITAPCLPAYPPGSRRRPRRPGRSRGRRAAGPPCCPCWCAQEHQEPRGGTRPQRLAARRGQRDAAGAHGERRGAGENCSRGGGDAGGGWLREAVCLGRGGMRSAGMGSDVALARTAAGAAAAPVWATGRVGCGVLGLGVRTCRHGAGEGGRGGGGVGPSGAHWVVKCIHGRDPFPRFAASTAATGAIGAVALTFLGCAASSASRRWPPSAALRAPTARLGASSQTAPLPPRWGCGLG